MRLPLALLGVLLFPSTLAFAAEPCQRIHGRAVFYSADGQFRIWHIGTHHEFMPPRRDDSDGTDWGSWEKVWKYINDHQGTPADGSRLALFADFLVCPTKPFRKGAAQPAEVKAIYHPHVISRDLDGEPQ